MTRRMQLLLIALLALMALGWAALSMAAAEEGLLPVGNVPLYVPAVDATYTPPPPVVACCELPQPPARPTAYPYPYPEPPQPPYQSSVVWMPSVFNAYPYP